MTYCLYRDAFLDRVWGPADLDAVAEFWLRLYESAAKPHSFTPLPEHRTEIRIRGVPRGDAGRVGAALAARAAAADFWDPRVTHPDEDTISLATGASDGRDAPPDGLGLPILAAVECDVLAIEILAAFQAVHLRGVQTLPPRLREAHRILSGYIAPIQHDRIFSEDIAAVSRLIHDEVLPLDVETIAEPRLDAV